MVLGTPGEAAVIPGDVETIKTTSEVVEAVEAVMEISLTGDTRIITVIPKTLEMTEITRLIQTAIAVGNQTVAEVAVAVAAVANTTKILNIMAGRLAETEVAIKIMATVAEIQGVLEEEIEAIPEVEVSLEVGDVEDITKILTIFGCFSYHFLDRVKILDQRHEFLSNWVHKRAP